MVVKTFEQFLDEYARVRDNNENSNIPPGIQDPGDMEDDVIEEPEIVIRPETHDIKLVVLNGMPVTDFSELALVKDPSGNLHILQFDATEPDFNAYKPKLIMGDDFEYLDLTDMGVEAIANDIPMSDKGMGVKDLESKMLVKIDGEAAEALIAEMDGIIAKLTPEQAKPYAAMKQVLMDYIGA